MRVKSPAPRSSPHDVEPGPTVQDELEALIEEARRRARRRRAGYAAVLAAAALAGTLYAALNTSGGGSSHAPGPRVARHASSFIGGSLLRPWSNPGRVLLRGLVYPEAYAAGGRLYVSQQETSSPGWLFSELMRIDPVSGRVLAVRRLGSAFDQALLAGQTLWVTTTRGRTSWLWRLDPGSLHVRSRNTLPGSGANDGRIGTLAVAGGWLWVGVSDRIDRVSLASGRVTGQVTVPGGDGVDVAADCSGRMLLDSEGHELADVQRRDPHTGALIASSGRFEGVTKPYIGGISSGGVWISAAGGMMGGVERLSLATLRPAPIPAIQHQAGVSGPPVIEGTNAITAPLIAGVLFITQAAGGPQRNYCADPSTGRALAPLPARQDAELLAADNSSIYYIPDLNLARAELARAPMDPRCRSGATGTT
jgi:hypothetical protein